MDTQCYLAIGIPTVIDNSPAFNFFPNPASHYLTLHFADARNSQIRILNLIGELNYIATVQGEEINLNISSYANGIYFIEVASGSKVSRAKFVKQ